MTRPAPYPADTRAKGWRFELNYEQIDQSDTWGLAGAKAFEGLPLARPLLLAMWYAAWKQTPCGTLPSDEALIAAAVGIPASVFADYRDVLMRGWWLADDGRLYHDTLADRVLEMLTSRSNNAKRVADFKARQREQREGNALPTRNSHSNNDTGTRTGTNTEANASVGAKSPRATRKCPASFAVTPELIAWAASEAPGVPLETETAKLRDHTFKTAISDWPVAWRNWMRKAQGFINDRNGKAGTGPVTFADKARERMDALTGRTPSKPKHMGDIRDVANLLDH